jgi:hypothetical protein
MSTVLEKYEELCICKDTRVRCKKGELLSTMRVQYNKICNQDIYLQKRGENWDLLYETGEGGKRYQIHVWPAVKIRVEASISQLDEVVSAHVKRARKIFQISDVCCDVKRFDTKEDFLIADLYMGYEDSQ